MLRLAEGVILSLIILSYPFLPTILLRVTPTANRNSYRVARLVGWIPRVACFARNPGLGKRNSVRVAAACVSPSPCLRKPLPMPSPRGGSPTGGPSPALPKGREFHWRPLPIPPKGREFLLAVFEVVVWCSFPLGKVRMGLAGVPSPWGRLGWGLCGVPSPWGRLGWGFGWGFYANALV